MLLLSRLEERERNFELAQVFGRSPPSISETYNVVLDHVFQHAMPTMRLEIREEHFPSFANVVRARGCPEGHCFGFIDGTMSTICMTTYGQEAKYNGWKQQRKVKYECVVLPNFLTSDWFGPTTGGAHHLHVLADSNMVTRLLEMRDRLDVPLCIYGDPLYPVNEVIIRAT